MNTKQAVAFAILMQNNKGIINKAPSYVREKLDLCEAYDDPRGLLDASNQAIYDAWLERWAFILAVH